MKERNVLFENKFVRLTEEDHYAVYETPDIVAVMPVMPDGNVILINQYRIPIGRKIFELVTGGIEEGEEREEAARREVKEETGHEVRNLDYVGSYFTAPGYMTQRAHVFVAHVGDYVGDALESHEKDFELSKSAHGYYGMKEIIKEESSHPYLTIAWNYYNK